MKAKIKRIIEEVQIEKGTIEALVFMSIIAVIAILVN
jgi:hypothetical protein